MKARVSIAAMIVLVATAGTVEAVEFLTRRGGPAAETRGPVASPSAGSVAAGTSPVAPASAVAGGVAAAQSEPWQSDWAEFAKAYSKTNNEPVLGKKFVGKTVVWKGKVTDLRPSTADESAQVTLKMSPPFALGIYTVDGITLRPSKGEEAAWAPVKIGQEVEFQTQLDTTSGEGVPINISRLTETFYVQDFYSRGGRLIRVLLPEGPLSLHYLQGHEGAPRLPTW